MTAAELHLFYQEILDRVSVGQVDLPSLPDIAMQVRQAIGAESTTSDTLTAIISKDPGLTAYLVQAASSPIYRRAVPPKTLADVVGLLGFSSVRSLVMLHSARGLVDINNPLIAKLFNYTWERLITKTSIASFLAQQFRGMPVDHVQLALLLSEIGSLTVLSTLASSTEAPNSDVYFAMCRRYSKRIGAAVLSKWEVEQTIIDMVAQCGEWDVTWDGDMNLLDIANLALYHTVLMTVEKPALPDLASIAAFDKIPKTFKECSKPNWLAVVAHNNDAIQGIVSSFR